ncbi:MAG: tRNA (adenosine(37)-N6)-threonylcarbamoyltransferase complex dimerization subunit type 1 TsaB [Candidatus Omnitrophica bacterium]|nr:tRNA (adenosine(37)-N6)-threonylcarbamoyltransferase complex dimerization subunit type 1 TsaB [Candidatus Omnitrophota bacterium]
MKILAFDTSTKFLSIACMEDSSPRAVYHKDVCVRHSEMLVVEIKNLLKKLNWKLTDIDLICVGSGPGSFTGLRIAFATLKGLCLAGGTRVSAIPSMDAMIRTPAAGVYKKTGKKLIAPFLDARKGKVYTCIYEMSRDKIHKLTDYLLVRAEDFLKELKEEVFFFGDAVPKYEKELVSCKFALLGNHMDWYPKAVEIGRAALKRSVKKADDVETLEPLYLYEKECNVLK